MKPPRLPGTEKFRFCDKKYDQQKVSFGCDDEADNEVISDSKLLRKNSFLFSLHTRSLSNESLLCSCVSEHSHRKANMLASGSSSCTLEELISQASLPMVRLEHNKRKPNLPISSRMTSRVFTLTSCLSHLNDHEEVYYRDKDKSAYKQYEHASKDSLLLPRNRFPDGFDCSSTRSSTPISLDSTESTSPKLSESKCRLHSVGNLRHHNSHRATTNLMINSTSHASLMSDESSTSMSSAQRTECDDSLRSFSCSPVEHWAKSAVIPNRLSTSSQLSWEDESCLAEVT